MGLGLKSAPRREPLVPSRRSEEYIAFDEDPLRRRLSYSERRESPLYADEEPEELKAGDLSDPIAVGAVGGPQGSRRGARPWSSRGLYEPRTGSNPDYLLLPQDDLIDLFDPLTLRPRRATLSPPRRRASSRRSYVDEEEEVGEKVPVLRPPEFNGKGSWTEFRYRFENVARSNRWSAETCCDQLRHCLVGEAGSVLIKNAASRYWDYQTLLEELGTVFGPQREHSFSWLRKLNNRERKKGESLYALRDDLCQLVDRAYPEMPPRQREGILVRHFTQALGNPHVIAKVLDQEPATIVEAYDIASRAETQWETALSMGATSKGDASHRAVREAEATRAEEATRTLLEEVSKIGQAVSKLEDAQSQKEKVAPAVPTSPDTGWGFTCFVCGSGDHLARDCPVPCGKCGRRGHATRDCFRRGRGGARRGRGGPGRGRGDVCHRCQEPGHFARDCLAPAPVSRPEPSSLN